MKLRGDESPPRGFNLVRTWIDSLLIAVAILYALAGLIAWLRLRRRA